MPPLIVLTGPQGAGKSTVAEALAERFDPSAVVPADRFWGFLRRGAVDPWLPNTDAQNEAVAEAAGLAAVRLAQRSSVVFDGLIGPWFLSRFAAAIGAPGLHYVVLLPPLEVCVERVRTRAGHGFTDLDETRAMWSRFADADIDPRHVLRDPTDAPEAVAAEVATELETGRFRFAERS